MKPLYQIFVLFSIICLSTEGINSFMEELPFFRIKRELLYKCLKAPNTIPSGIINCIRNETNIWRIRDFTNIFPEEYSEQERKQANARLRFCLMGISDFFYLCVYNLIF